MSPNTPSDPQKGKPAGAEKPDVEKADVEKPEAKAAAAEQAAPEKAVEAPKKAPAKKPDAKKPAQAKAPAKPKAKAAKAAQEKTEPEAVAKAESTAEKAEPKAATKPKAQTPAPQRRRVVRAQARYVRTSARKARMVCGHLRGKSVTEARAILAFTARDVARDWTKLLESAIANAENNHELLEDDLLVHEAYADEGPTIKRFRPRAQGRATPIRKRTSHLTITLTPKP
jgi:ribosomal protein L22